MINIINILLPVNYNTLTQKEKAIVRAEYVKRQGGRCMYCNESLYAKPPLRITEKAINWSLFPPNFLRHPVHLQHNHTTGMTEGAVHSYCNAVMWQYERR